MDNIKKEELLIKLCRIQAQGTAPIKVGIGWKDENGLILNGLTISECPPKVIAELVALGYYLTLSGGCIHVISCGDQGGL